MPPVSCLSLHTGYRCRHAGACCEGHWSIPVEPHVVATVAMRGIGVGRGSTFATESDSAGTAHVVTGRSPDGACVFFDREAGRLCGIHRHAGPSALPSACRHFPRLALHDDRGTFITLSHFCPTAAALLLHDGAVTIEDAPEPLRLDAMEGFEARGALPPLLRPGVLTDLEGYAAWEAAGIAALTRRDSGAGRALEIIEAATERVRTWEPGGEPLAARVREAFHDAAESAAAWRDGSAAWPAGGHVAGNYLAARLFANHLAYEGRGLRTIVAWLRHCLGVLRREVSCRAEASGIAPTAANLVAAARAADLILVHGTDTRAFARRAARAVEGDTHA